MWNRSRLSREILGIFGISFLMAIFGFWVLNEVANRILLSYVEQETLGISEYQLIDMQYWILGISMVSGVVLFLVLFLALVGDKLSYISEIVKGIDALGRHEWDYEIPVKDKNELAELAERVNVLSKEEQEFQKKEKKLQEEKASLIRSLSHDIRTPLTSLMSYSEFMRSKENLTAEEVTDYMILVEQKAQQMKVLTDRLLDGGKRKMESIENGRFFIEQLVDEWVSELEEEFVLKVDTSGCPQFSGEFDIEELRRIFDNLASNIRKYADERSSVVLRVFEKDGRVCIYQSNEKKEMHKKVESTQIGVESIRNIAGHYGGSVEVIQTERTFSIQIILAKV